MTFIDLALLLAVVFFALGVVIIMIVEAEVDRLDDPGDPDATQPPWGWSACPPCNHNCRQSRNCPARRSAR